MAAAGWKRLRPSAANSCNSPLDCASTCRPRSAGLFSSNSNCAAGRGKNSLLRSRCSSRRWASSKRPISGSPLIRPRGFPRAARSSTFAAAWAATCYALAQRGAALGVDRSEIAALFAAANLAALGNLASARASGVVIGDVEHASLKRVAAWHIDPDRRPQGRRTTRVELHEPGPAVIELLRAACGAGAVKLAPAAELPQSWQQGAELEWISRGGECRQLVVWFGPLARSVGLRRATVVSRNAERGTRNAEQEHPQASGGRQPGGDYQATVGLPFESQTTEQGTTPRQGRGAGDPEAGNFTVRSIVGRPALDIPAAAKLGRYLAEPDAAVLAAELGGALAAERNLAPIAPGSAYLTGDQAEPDAALAWFEVSDELPFDLKRLKVAAAAARLRTLGNQETGRASRPRATAPATARAGRQLRNGVHYSHRRRSDGDRRPAD